MAIIVRFVNVSPKLDQQTRRLVTSMHCCCVQGGLEFAIAGVGICTEFLHQHADQLKVPMLCSYVDGGASFVVAGVDISPELLDEACHDVRISPLLTRSEERSIRRIAVLMDQLTSALH